MFFSLGPPRDNFASKFVSSRRFRFEFESYFILFLAFFSSCPDEKKRLNSLNSRPFQGGDGWESRYSNFEVTGEGSLHHHDHAFL